MKNKTEALETSTGEIWRKIEDTDNLYFYKPTVQNGRITGTIYFRGTVNGQGISRSLGKISVGQAKRDAASLIEKEKRLEKGHGKISLTTLVERYRTTRNGKNIPSINNTIGHLKKFPALAEKSIDSIKFLDVATFFEKMDFKGRKKANLNNKTVNTLNSAFQFAVQEKYILENPIAKQPGQKVSPLMLNYTRPKPQAPTVAQFEEIRTSILKNRYTDTGKQAWELFSFCGFWGCYEAEARNLDWQHFNWENGTLNLRREKTQEPYTVPIYPYAREFILKLWEDRGKPITGKVFAIATVKRSLETACKKLGYPHFTILNFRQMFVVRLLTAGVSIKKISKWVGHSEKDGGFLIMTTYSHVIDNLDKESTEREIAKIV